jgi:hypothetical protein
MAGTAWAGVYRRIHGGLTSLGCTLASSAAWPARSLIRNATGTGLRKAGAVSGMASTAGTNTSQIRSAPRPFGTQLDGYGDAV